MPYTRWFSGLVALLLLTAAHAAEHVRIGSVGNIPVYDDTCEIDISSHFRQDYQPWDRIHPNYIDPIKTCAEMRKGARELAATIRLEAEREQLEAQARRCAVNAITSTPPGDIELTIKSTACARPLAEYLFAHGKNLGEAVDYSSYVTATAQGQHFGVTPKPYKPIPFTIDGINRRCGTRGFECLDEPHR